MAVEPTSKATFSEATSHAYHVINQQISSALTAVQDMKTLCEEVQRRAQHAERQLYLARVKVGVCKNVALRIGRKGTVEI